MTQGFPARELARPPSRREIAAADKEFRALAAWYRTQDEGAVARECGYPSRMAARVAINRAVERLKAQREDHLDRLRLWYDSFLVEMSRDLMEAWRAGERSRGEMILKVIERHSKMAGLEHDKALNVNVGTFVLAGEVSPEQLEAIPAGAEVIDARLPPRRAAPLVEPADRGSLG